MDKKDNEEQLTKKWLTNEIRGLERDYHNLDLSIVGSEIFLKTMSGIMISADFEYGLIMSCAFAMPFSLASYLALRKNQELKGSMAKFFTECYGNVSRKNIKNYSKAIDRNNRKVTLMTLLGLTIGGMTAGYTLGEIIFQDEMKWLAGLGLGALTIYGSTKLYKNKTKRFGDKVKFKCEEESEK